MERVCSVCQRPGHTADEYRKKDKVRDKKKKCLFCNFEGYNTLECCKMKAAQQQQQLNCQLFQQGLPPQPTQPTNQSNRRALPDPMSAPSQQNPQQWRRPQVPTCYNCSKPSHISTNCPEPRRQQQQYQQQQYQQQPQTAPQSNQNRRANTAPTNYVASAPDMDTFPLYVNFPALSSFAKPLVSHSSVSSEIVFQEGIDEQSIVLESSRKIELPLYHVLTQDHEKREVFSLPSPTEAMLGELAGILHSFTKTPSGQNLLTVWNMCALFSIVPMSTVKVLNLSFVSGSDVAFVVANGSKMEPLGYCLDMHFSVPEDTHQFIDKVYVVESALFQLLLGVKFLHRHWAGIFVPWAKIVLCKPKRVEIACSVKMPQGGTKLTTEVMDELDGISRQIGGYDDDEPTIPVSNLLFSLPLNSLPMNSLPLNSLPLNLLPLEVGHKSLVDELDQPITTDFQAEASTSRCLTMVTSRLPTCALELLVTQAEIPLTSLPAKPLDMEDGVMEDSVVSESAQIGNIHTFHDPAYSAKDKDKLSALPHVRAFLTSGFVPGDATTARLVRWLGKKIQLEDGSLWKVDKTLKLRVLESPDDVYTVLRELHDGFGHHRLASVYNHFKLRYWVPCASKMINSIPEFLRTHHDSGFDNEVMENLTEILRINHHWSTPYYPQSNGLVEHLVQTFKNSLKRTIMDQIHGTEGLEDEPSSHWAHLVDSLLYAYCCTPYSATGVSPAMLLFGRDLKLPGDQSIPLLENFSLDHKELVLNYLKFLTNVIPTLRNRPSPKDAAEPKEVYKVNDRVWIRVSRHDVGFLPVFAPRWKGPYIVKERLDKNVYRIQTDPLVSGKHSMTLQYPINGMRLKRVSEQEFYLLMEKGKKAEAVVAEVPVSFVMVFDGSYD